VQLQWPSATSYDRGATALNTNAQCQQVTTTRALPIAGGL